MKELSIRTSRHEEFVDITNLVEQAVRAGNCSAVLVSKSAEQVVGRSLCNPDYNGEDFRA